MGDKMEQQLKNCHEDSMRTGINRILDALLNYKPKGRRDRGRRRTSEKCT